MIKSIDEIMEEGNDYLEDDNLEDAFRCFLHAAELGDDEGAKLVGDFYAKGDVVDANFDKAKEWLQLAISRGNVNAYRVISSLYSNEELFEEHYDPMKEFEYLLKGANLGDCECQLLLYGGYSDGEYNLTHDEAMSWLRKSVSDDNIVDFLCDTIFDIDEGSIKNEDGTRSRGENDNAMIVDIGTVLIEIGKNDAYDLVGNAYEQGGYGIEQDMDKAMQLYLEGASIGAKDCAIDVYFACMVEDSKYYDVDKARKYLFMAVEQGDTFAKGIMGSNYYTGDDGFEQDIDKAEEYLLDAIKEEEYGGFYWRLGEVYLDKGELDGKIAAKGVAYLEKGATLGNGFAMYDLYKCYMDGTGTVENFTKALEYLRSGAEAGNVRSQYVLGAYMARGDVEGVDKDYATAEKYLLRAVEYDFLGAYEYLAIIYDNGGDGVEQDINKANMCRAKAQAYYDAN